MSDVQQALDTWRRHRRSGTMPPMRTLEVIVGAARESIREPSTPELARGLVHATQCPNCDRGTIYNHAPPGIGEPMPCLDCGGSGRLDGTALQAAAEAQADKLMEGYHNFRSPKYGGSELERWEIVQMLQWSITAAVDEYLRVLGGTE